MTLAIDPRSESLRDAQKKLEMKKGFDIGLKMWGNPAAFCDMLANMCHGGMVIVTWNEG